MKKTLNKTHLLSAACCAALVGTPAFAQDVSAPEEQENAFDTIVVTAQKREQSIQDVGITVSAVGEEQIDELELSSDVLRLASIVPGLTAVNGSAGTPSYRIRGAGIVEFSAAFEGPVGVHVDEAFHWKPILSAFGFFDVNRIEVLKGPQGTVFGRNTTGGAVNVYSNTPEDEFGVGFSARYGRFDRLEMQGHVTGPITDELSYRVAVERKDHRGGPFFNQFTNDEEGDLSQTRIRGILEYDNDTTLVRATVEHSQKEGELQPYDNLFQDIPGGFNAGGTTNVNEDIREPRGRFTVNQDFQQLTDAEEQNYQLRIEHDFGNATLTSLTNFRDHIRENTEDTDNTPDASFNINWDTAIEQFSQEIRLGGTAFNDRLTFLVGGYYEDGKLRFVETFDTLDGAISSEGTRDLGGAPFLSGLFQAEAGVDDENWAIFTNNEFALTDQLAFVFGARYTEEVQDFQGQQYVCDAGLTREECLVRGGNIVDTFAQIRPDLRGNPVTEIDSRKDTSFDYKLGLNYNLNDDVLLFGSYSTGFRSGSFTFSPFNPLGQFDPEEIKAAELGAKTTWLGGALRWNTSLFWSEIENYQDNVNQANQATPFRTNIGVLRAQGVESEIQYNVNDNWYVQLGGAYVDAEVTESDFFFGTLPALGNTGVNTPELEFTGVVSYTTPINNDWSFDANVLGNYQSSRFLESDNTPDSRVGGFGTLDANIGIESADGRYRFSIWGKNITNTNYLLYINDIPAIATFLAVRADPATYGVSVDFNF